MNNKIRQGLKNTKGSSLAFVLIISMVLMIMVASIMTVANSGFTFTQESVESRQAYIDAKSVIEFGKIEINSRMTALEAKDQQLKTLYEDLDKLIKDNQPTDGKEDEIRAKVTDINSYVNNNLIASYYIVGDENNISKTLAKTLDPTKAVGILTVETKKVEDNNNLKTNKYIFNIDTQNLRRKLDFEAAFNYEVTTPEAVLPTLPSDLANWTGAFIQDKNKTGLEMKFTSNEKAIAEQDNVLAVDRNYLSLTIGEKNGNGKFQWEPHKTLDLDVANVCFIEPIPSSNKADPTNGDDSTFDINAETVIFEGDLIINATSCLIINCTNLWVKGNIIINTDTTASDTFKNQITATNIIVGGASQNNTIFIKDPTKMTWSYNNFWLNGIITTSYPNSESPGSSGETRKINNLTTVYY
ncbi:hypothetical protein [Acetobacterium sp.]|uniref:hypothetical protein n=1 Tax=Acetobacterium sp. TaxID=1872094 RepID=UPI002F41FDCB